MMVTQVNLYINIDSKLEFIYKLLSQLYYKSIRFIVVLNSYEDLEEFSYYLYNNVLDSFLAHTIWHENQLFPFNSPIVLTMFSNLNGFDINYIIINLSDSYIIQKTQKIVEFFANSDQDLIRARDSYNFYKKKEFKISYFDIVKK